MQKWILVGMGVIVGAVLIWFLAARALAHFRDVKLKPGDPAPPFSLPETDGKVYSLADFRGKTVVLAWYIKAATPG